MSKIVRLEIKNFRSIKNLVLEFDAKKRLVCFIGRGDSGKTSVLEAISAVLSPIWNLTFHDTDFFNCSVDSPIEIYASIVDVPEKLLSIEKFGLYIRLFDEATRMIIDDVSQEDENDNCKPLLTIKLAVNKFLEPKWTVESFRGQEEKAISASERSLFYCNMTSDSIDRHFSWNKGNPLYSLLKMYDEEADQEESNIILQSLRLAKDKIDSHSFDELKLVTEIVKVQAGSLGLNITNTKTTLDFKEILVKEGRISLHEDVVPFRLKGKGSKRLASLAIQLALAKDGGVILVDEIEQGLEPDRIKNLIRALKESENGQIFLTTHSHEVVTELGADPLYLILRDKIDEKSEGRRLEFKSDPIDSVVRACPEAFFAKKVIVCEGATEVGICRALDSFRKAKGKVQMAFQDCAYIDGTGNTLVERAFAINDVKLKTLVLCDSDDSAVNKQKADITKAGIDLIDCEADFCLEKQIFNDLPWDAIQELITYALIVHKKNDSIALEAGIKSKLPKDYKYEEGWLKADTAPLRSALAQSSIVDKKEWFKRVDHGEFLGSVIFKYFDNMDDNSQLKKNLLLLNTWIDT